jgi:hypothetical protein
MNVLLISRPGLSLLRTLRESETAWDAIRFYGPIGLTIGVYIPVSTLAGAISLTSDLRFFIRKYTVDHLFQLRPGVYYTAALSRSRYLTRDLGVSEEWPYRLVYWIENGGKIRKQRAKEWNSEEVIYSSLPLEPESDEENEGISIEDRIRGRIDMTYDKIPGGYLFEVWCTKPEHEMF